MTTLFSSCTRSELEVLISGLELIDVNKQDEDHKESITLCLGTLKYELNDRYLRWEKNDEN